LDIRSRSSDAEFVDKGEYSSWWDTTATNSDEGVKPGVVPAADIALVDEFSDLAFGHDGPGEVEAAVLGLLGAVDLEGVAKPVVGLARVDEFGGTERVSIYSQISNLLSPPPYQSMS